MAPSRSPHSLTTNRPDPELCGHGGQHRRADGQQGRAAGLHPRKSQAGAEVQPASWSASSSTWCAGSSTWLTSPGPADGRRRARAVASRARARTVPPLTMVRSTTPGCPANGAGDGSHRLRRPGSQRELIGHRQRVTGPELAPQTGGPDRRTGGHGEVVRVPDGRFEAPAAQVQAERRAGSRPHPGALADEAQPRLLFSAEDEHLGPDDPFEALHDLGAVGRRRAGRRWPGRRRSRPGTRPAPPGAVWRPRPTPPPGRGGCCRVPPRSGRD